ncbi:hypothetical protein MMC12_001964 [Toensbergia leucococca]|nr:hypothetical protein [Toensbergia leucococca]
MAGRKTQFVPSSFYLIDESCTLRKITPWDPWPVKTFRPNATWKAAHELIRQRNRESIDNCLDKVVILPASGSVPGIHGGSDNVDLYSFRSPSTLPARHHLWRTPGSKLMVRKGSQWIPLETFLKTFKAIPWHPIRDYRLWKSLPFTAKSLKQLDIPAHLHDQLYQKWWAVNGFRFLELPGELRNMIMSISIGHQAQPYQQAYRPSLRFPKPNTSLLFVNKQLHLEAEPILYSQLTFTFYKHGQFLRFFEFMSPVRQNTIRSLELIFDHETLLDFFGAQVGLRNRRPKCGYSTADYYLKPSMFHHQLRLQYLRINFPHPREHKTSRWLRSGCQRTICLWIWAAAQTYLREIPHVEFVGCIKNDQREEWLDTLQLERQGIVSDPTEVSEWQKQLWDIAYGSPRPLLCVVTK